MKDKRFSSLGNTLLLSGAIIFVMFAVSSYVWFQIPAGARVCTHWNAAGECDGYGSKFAGIFLMPIVAVGIVGLFTLIPRIDPRAVHIAQSRKAYAAVWVTVLLFFLAMHAATMLDVLGYEVAIARYVPFIVGLMFVAIGSSLGKVRSNFFFGIRTPWTLSSELSWQKTHQLGGKLFVILGLFFTVASLFLPAEAWVYGLLGGILVLVVALTGYSYFVWKGDAAREPS